MTTRLYDLLPADLRRRDDEQGGPLAALLGLIDAQIARLDADLDQLHDDQFIETCADWVVPYIGELVGHRAGAGGLPHVASPRADVARTIAYRRRKGTTGVLQQIAHDLSGWPALVVELRRQLAISQHLAHPRPHAHHAPDLRDPAALARHAGGFATTATTVDLRPEARGLHGVGVFLWRLRAAPLRDLRLAPVAADRRRFRLHPLGRDAPLFARATPVDELHERPPGLADVPAPIARRELHAALADYYGPGKSVRLVVDGAAVEPAAVVAADLSDRPGDPTRWAREARPGQVLLDPVLGRVALAAPAASLAADIHLGVADELGAGPWTEPASAPPNARLAADQPLGPALAAGRGVVELTASARYAADLAVRVADGQTLTLRAAEGACPIVRGDLTVTGGPGSALELVGLTVCGAVIVPADPAAALPSLSVRACTFVPGRTLRSDGGPEQPGHAGLVVHAPGHRLALARSIVAAVHAVADARVEARRCVIDAAAATRRAYAAPGGGPGAPLILEQCTVIGTIDALALELVSNTIVVAALAPGDPLPAPVTCARRQIGCVRFSSLPPGALVPRRFRCQPDGAADPLRVAPTFTSLRFGDPGYAQLGRRCPPEIRRGADDESEMGVYHDLFHPHIEANLRARVDEYLRVGLRAALVFAT